ncbi:MAG: SDR family oxidoreductase [Myxococcales bacterium]|nr:SDR family oxidoreductase [Myxococcales bacterium]MCB9709254.1 SDR family oxidoreductase [Myxococcales bacterium]
MNTQGRLSGKVAIVTGASRGIGRAVAMAFAREGADVVIAAKSDTETGRLPGSIYTVAREIEALGARALPLKVDVRNDDDVQSMVDRSLETFGRLDVLINNAGALWWHDVIETPMKRFDLVMDVNVRGAFACTLACLPHLKAHGCGHVVMYSPPVDLEALPGKVAYLISKFGMTMLAHGLAKEVEGQGVSVNALWPVTAIESQATLHFGLGSPKTWRKPDILADATLEIITTPPSSLNGEALLDEPFLRDRGWSDFKRYRCDPDHEPPRAALKDFRHS